MLIENYASQLGGPPQGGAGGFQCILTYMFHAIARKHVRISRYLIDIQLKGRAGSGSGAGKGLARSLEGVEEAWEGAGKVLGRGWKGIRKGLGRDWMWH